MRILSTLQRNPLFVVPTAEGENSALVRDELLQRLAEGWTQEIKDLSAERLFHRWWIGATETEIFGVREGGHLEDLPPVQRLLSARYTCREMFATGAPMGFIHYSQWRSKDASWAQLPLIPQRTNPVTWSGVREHARAHVGLLGLRFQELVAVTEGRYGSFAMGYGNRLAQSETARWKPLTLSYERHAPHPFIRDPGIYDADYTYVVVPIAGLLSAHWTDDIDWTASSEEEWSQKLLANCQELGVGPEQASDVFWPRYGTGHYTNTRWSQYMAVVRVDKVPGIAQVVVSGLGEVRETDELEDVAYWQSFIDCFDQLVGVHTVILDRGAFEFMLKNTRGPVHGAGRTDGAFYEPSSPHLRYPQVVWRMPRGEAGYRGPTVAPDTGPFSVFTVPISAPEWATVGYAGPTGHGVTLEREAIASIAADGQLAVPDQEYPEVTAWWPRLASTLDMGSDPLGRFVLEREARKFDMTLADQVVATDGGDTLTLGELSKARAKISPALVVCLTGYDNHNMEVDPARVVGTLEPFSWAVEIDRRGDAPDPNADRHETVVDEDGQVAYVLNTYVYERSATAASLVRAARRNGALTVATPLTSSGVMEDIARNFPKPPLPSTVGEPEFVEAGASEWYHLRPSMKQVFPNFMLPTRSDYCRLAATSVALVGERLKNYKAAVAAAAL